MRTQLFRHLICLFALLCLSSGCSKEDGKEKEEGEDIAATFTVTPETGDVNTQFEFNAEGSFYRSYSSDGTIYYECTYRWDFDYQGGSDLLYDHESEEATTTHIYEEPGTYIVKLELAYDPMHLFIEPYTYERISKTIVVTEDNLQNPTAYFEVVNPIGYPNIFMFTFVGGSSDPQDPEDALRVRWDWENDGTYDTEFSNEHIANHYYKYPGQYTVKLQVKDTDENVDEAFNDVTVLGPGGEPCPGNDSVNYGGQTYTTVQIGNQCWLNENLNIGTLIQNTELPTQNTPEEIIEKYCYSNDPDSCAKYGGLYNWNEMMQYINEEGSRGICPNGWHIPTDEEWKELEGTIDSQYGYPDEHWDQFGYFRGWDLGTNIRSQSYWYNQGMGKDTFGFNAQPGGQLENNGEFEEVGIMGYYWTSTGNLSGYARYITTGNKVAREIDQKEHGYAVRCIKD